MKTGSRKPRRLCPTDYLRLIAVPHLAYAIEIQNRLRHCGIASAITNDSKIPSRRMPEGFLIEVPAARSAGARRVLKEFQRTEEKHP